MSVSVFDRNKVGTADELTPVATKNNQRVYVGTKKAVEAAMKDGDIGNNSVVYITDDYDETSIVDTANYAVTAGTAENATNAVNATNADNATNAKTANKALKVDYKANVWNLEGGSQLPRNCDMKTIIIPGSYVSSNGTKPIDLPSGFSIYGLLKVWTTVGSTNWITQEYESNGDPANFARRLTTDGGITWTHWYIFSGTKI